MTTYYVSKQGTMQGTGTQKDPFLTIQQGANIAKAGDKVIVHAGEYRESVKPNNQGLSHTRRITYQAAANEKVVIKGSEVVTHWERVSGTTWQAVVDNELFGAFNPFAQLVWGDWLTSGKERVSHLGEVYLNGQSLYEVNSREAVDQPSQRQTVVEFFIQQEVPERYPERTKYVWFAEVAEEQTILYANFQEVDPRTALVEINCRQTCFFPDKTGVDYITVRGFELCQAATPWAPPTGDQKGLIGPNWSKGWIIEDNLIHDAKCSAISLGKEASTGDNYYSKRLDKPGYTYQLESVFTALESGWSKEKIGSHLVRNNHIYNCGQNGIVGHLGCVFSQIYNNHIHDISLKREFYGWEMAGIKLHAALDVQIVGNRIHDTALGIWSDWQTQGTRISRNLFYANGADLFVEVSHGPYLVDHNILGSSHALINLAQGGAYLNNIIAGGLRLEAVPNRATPYHLPHSTKVKGYGVVYGGDDRYYNNIFIGSAQATHAGTASYDGHHLSLTDYIQAVQQSAPTDVETFIAEKDPVYINDNVYLNHSEAFALEEHKLEMKEWDPEFKLRDEGETVILELTLPPAFERHGGLVHSTTSLGRVRLADQNYEQPNGDQLNVDTDFLATPLGTKPSAGPLQGLVPGKNVVTVWKN